MGYPAKPEAFKNQCLLISVIYGYWFNEEKNNPRGNVEAFQILQRLTTKRSSIIHKDNAGIYLQSLIDDFKSAFPQVPDQGPYDFHEVAPLLALHLNCQIHLIEGIDGEKALVSSYPPVFDQSLSQIFLKQVHDNHVVLLTHIKSVFTSLGRKICFVCKKTNARSVRHYCKGQGVKTCFVCKRILATAPLKYMSGLDSFCDSELLGKRLDQPKHCQKCNFRMWSENCFSSHIELCGHMDHSRRGWKCDNCHQVTTGKNSIVIQQNHECFKKKKICSNCHFEKEAVGHQCRVKKQVKEENFPSLAFYGFQFQAVEFCRQCQQIRSSFKRKENLTWLQLHEHISFPDLKCETHKLFVPTENKPNACVIYREIELEKFQKIILTDDQISEENWDGDSVTYSYLSDDLKEKFPLKFKTKFSKKVAFTREKIDFLKTKKQKTMLDKFLILIFQPEWQNTTFLSFRSNGGEHVSLYKKLMETGFKANAFFDGNKISYLQLQELNINFYNASAFLAGSLLDLKKQFNLNDPLIYFPEKLNDSENYNYKGNSVPNLEFFVNFLDTPSEYEDKLTFWNESQLSGRRWCFKEELISSLDSRVLILMKACLQFVKLHFEFQSNLKAALLIESDDLLHPFGKDIVSISGLSYKTFVLFVMNNFEIFSVNNEYSGAAGNVSKKELEFAAFHSHFNSKFLYRHAFNHPEGQQRFGNFEVDLYSPLAKEVIQFNGCEYHGHFPCPINEKKGRTKDSHNYLKKSFTDLEKEMKTQHQYLTTFHSNDVKTIKTVWECEWDEFKKVDLDYELYKILKMVPTRPRLRLVPRATVRGGLLEVFKMKWSKSLFPNEVFKYSDVNSLYTKVAIDNPFPIGKCKIEVAVHDIDFTNRITFVDGHHCLDGVPLVCGAAHVLVEAPPNLRKPFLQYRVDDKFSFLSLCRSCAETKSSKCNHSKSEQRAFSSCWIIAELDKAVTLGYKILVWYEIHFYPETSFLLRDYSKFLFSEKIKNSGWPKDIVSDEQRTLYCNELNLKMNLPDQFKLTPDKILDNPAHRQLAKSQMNNFYGKFSQNSNFKKHVEIENQNKLEEQIQTNGFPVSIFQVGERKVLLEFEDLNAKPSKQANIYIGAHINAYARIFMYDFMTEIENCGGKVYSIDTDGLFYSLPKDISDPLPFSNACGDFKLMFEVDDEILGYYALGPRNYSILYKSVGDVIKSKVVVKGLSLQSYELANLIDAHTFETFLEDHFNKKFNKISIPQKKQYIDYEKKIFASRLQMYTFENDLYVKRYFPKKPDKCYSNYPYGFKN